MLLRVLAVVVASMLCVAQVTAQPYPSRPVKLINPFPPGSPVDTVARLLAQKMQETLGQPVIVDYRAGAGGTIGAGSVAKSAPDGYTLLVTSSSTHTIAPAILKSPPYDPQKDFVPISLVAWGPLVVVVHPSVPAKSLGELVQLARSDPGRLAYGSSGTGTILHLGGALFESVTGTQLTHVPYKGAVPASTDLLGGQVQLMFDSIANATPHVRAGKLRALAVLTPRRSASLPDVPTASEAGVQGLEFPAWIGVFAPSGTPRDIVATLVRTIAGITTQADVRERWQAAGLEPEPGGNDESFARQIGDDRRRFVELVRSANIERQ